MATHQFQTEVKDLLHLIINSLYSHPEIFLRELVSNASDALDKMKYLTLTDDAFKGEAFEPTIEIRFDEENKKTITISDNGIGMNEVELNENLGTIARSGTKAFLAQMSGDKAKDSSMIGQFGVGFYSSFIVADSVEVTTRRAGEEAAYRWTSDGKGAYEVEPAERDEHGTTVVLTLNEDGKEYASRWRIEDTIKKYSNHIAFPIHLHYTKTDWDDKGNKKSETPTSEQINSASALWKRSKSDLSEEDYAEFYRSISHDTEEPLLYVHTHAEGTLEYTTLFYVPKVAPFDLYHAEYRPGVKLFVKRVFITDDEKELMPTYLRFVRGVIDSEDLPLNVSREILQHNRVLSQIRNSSVKKLLNEFAKLAEEDKERYEQFITQFNRPLKEGLYTDFANKEQLLDLIRFKSTKADGWTSLAEYKERMLPDQKAIYYITGENEQTLRDSPLLEAYLAKDIEVLLLTDEIDEIIAPAMGPYKETDLKPVNRADAGEDLKEKKDKKRERDAKPVVERIKKALGDDVKDVRVSVRLNDSPCCIVTDDSDPSLKVQEMLRAMGQKDVPEVKPILEINPDHPFLKRLSATDNEAVADDMSRLLLEQAVLLEGSTPKNPVEFVRRMNRILAGS